MLSIENVRKKYAKASRDAVDDLSMDVRAGELFGFLGPNGAGKTTTIKMIVGILTPDAGTITIDGRPMRGNAIDVKRKIGYVPDAQDSYDRLTGMEYLNFMADVYGVSPESRAQQIERYTKLFEIDGALREPVRSYSRGMKQKLTITGALLHKPRLWVLDEPMVGLDPHSAHVLKQEMRAHCDAGNTVFFSTHVLDVAERLCDRIGILRQGKLIAQGTLEQLRSDERGASLEQVFLELTDGADGEE
ncbi:MAG: ABC transporter ATP-binding protein [Oscillospiraceae bacterium]|jgi:ABC-2 type transport system ATP-binding protein|nr:ABC transporter ATP-binding protein [Oscillospiraceae bacterium]